MRRYAFIMMAALSGAAAAQSVLDCVDPDVLRTLLSQSQMDRTAVITAEVPAEVAALKLPGEFTWIGSAERITGRVDATTNAIQVTAAWRTSLAVDAAREAAAAALRASGWEVGEQPGMGMGVFVTAAIPVGQPACRDGQPVNFTVSALDGVSYVLFTIQRGNANLMCSTFPRSSITAGMGRYLPRLELPFDPASGAMARMNSSGGSSSSNSFAARAELTTQDSAANVARHFAAQMQQQGWVSDATWSGDTTAGSYWSRQYADATFHSTLSVTAVGNGQIITLLRVTKM